MQSHALRKELNKILEGTAFTRAPAVRRSFLEDWLYASDLPSLCTETALRVLETRLADAGWETMEEQGWLQFRKAAGEPPEPFPDGLPGPETACCRSLLARHPERENGFPMATVCQLIKAAEEGRNAYENTCAKLHRQWAERLRKGEALPAVSLRYFGE